MARWTAKCWLGSKSGYQQLEVQSNTLSGAEEQLKRIYGAQSIINLRQVSNSSPSGGSDASMGLMVIIGAIFLAVTFWPIALALLVLYIVYKIFI
jgi:hypothetical protein